MTPTIQTTPEIDENMELDFGTLLIAEAEDGSYEPIGVVSTIAEARVLAKENLGKRMTDQKKGENPMCPDRYVVWELAYKGYRIISIIEI